MNKTSKKQLKANRENAKKGGVKTQNGKEIAKYNATKHGIYSSKNIIPGESPRVFLRLAKEIKKDLKPRGAMEQILVEKIISVVWRQGRLMQFESLALESEALREYWNNYYDEHIYPFNAGQMKTINRYETMLDRALYRALRQLKELQKNRESYGSVS